MPQDGGLLFPLTHNGELPDSPIPKNGFLITSPNLAMAS
jgi:hypothetical protein